jgi:hypothetical protein
MLNNKFEAGAIGVRAGTASYYSFGPYIFGSASVRFTVVLTIQRKNMLLLITVNFNFFYSI